MSSKLKDSFDGRVIRSIAHDLKSVHGAFDERAFIAACLDGLDELELIARGWHVADAMHAHLPQPLAKAVRVVVESLGPELESSEDNGMTVFRYMPHAFFIARYGLGDFERSMQAQYEITKRFTAEFSIRYFWVTHPDKTHARMIEWARDPNVHVRRLVSEGSRPRLPWAQRLRAFQQDPSPVLELLELLKDDPERYVQRSVANNLNDIAKDHPEVVVDVCRRWSKRATPARAWIVKHALRSLVKAGHRGALGMLGVGDHPEVSVGSPVVTPRRVKLGDVLHFAFELTSTADKRQELLVDYAVHFVKADGTARPKVFKLRRLVLQPRERVTLESTLSFERLTTRRAYPGRHQIDVLVNGVAHPLTAVDIRATRT